MDITELKQEVDLLDYIRNNGCEVERVGTNTHRVNPCPVCGHQDHFTVYEDTNSYSSFNECCNGGSIIDYMMEVENMSKSEAVNQLKMMSGTSGVTVLNTETKISKEDKLKEEIGKMVEEAQKNSCDYYKKRGFSEKIISNYRLGYLPLGCQYGSDYKYIIPVSETHIILRNDNHTGERYKNICSKTDIFNLRYLQDPSLTERKIFITEGVFDALSLEELNCPAIAINSVKMADKLIKIITENKEHLKDKLLVLALDRDQSGRDASEKLINELHKMVIPYVELDLGYYKDVNEIFTEDREQLQKKLDDLHLSGTVYDYLLTEFECDQAKRLSEPDIKTGFDKLDSMLGGGLYPGLFVLGSATSLGKTALALQMADKIAEQGQSVLFFCLEMGRYEMTCRSLTRELYEQEKIEEITTGNVLKSRYKGDDLYSYEGFKDVLKRYMNHTAKYLSLIEGNFDIDVTELRRLIKVNIIKNGKKPVVFVDYLQVIKPSIGRMTDKQKIDSIVVELKRISRDLDIPVIAISSFNRAGYNGEVGFESFKESGAIEYTADVLFGLQLRSDDKKDLFLAKLIEPRPLELVILKNRRGKAYEKLELDYSPKQNYFQESN